MRKKTIAILAIIIFAVFLISQMPTIIEYFNRTEGTLEAAILKDFGLNAKDITGVQVVFYEEGRFYPNDKEEYTPLIEYLMSLNVQSVIPQKSVQDKISNKIIFIDEIYTGDTLSIYLTGTNSLYIWHSRAQGYSKERGYTTDKSIDFDYIRGFLNDSVSQYW